MRFTTLIDVDSLAANLRAPGWVVLDCRFELGKPSAGEAAYVAGHIPGAQYAHLDRDLAGSVGPTTGRHPLPDPALFAAKASAWGISADSQIVVYDQGNSFFAARAWWVFRWLGHEAVAVLDGGLSAWQQANRPTDSSAPEVTAQHFIARPNNEFVMDTDQVLQSVRAGAYASGARRLIDARGADRYAGENETIDSVGGHVPGAANVHYARNYRADGRLHDVPTLQSLWQNALAGADPCNITMMCGSGVSACVNLLALEHAGLKGARLYPGSWSEWVRDAARPVARGN
jgi:thiosulfate/3-mercaptopyruvate sulfurtransferase